MREKVEALKYHPKVLAKVDYFLLRKIQLILALFVTVCDELVFDVYFSACEDFELIETTKKRTLSGAGRADNADNFAFFNSKVDGFEYFKIPEAFFEIFNMYH